MRHRSLKQLTCVNDLSVVAVVVVHTTFSLLVGVANRTRHVHRLAVVTPEVLVAIPTDRVRVAFLFSLTVIEV